MARTTICTAILLLALAAFRPACAMQFTVETARGGLVFILARGEIHPGDLRLFRQALARLPPGATPRAMLLDSPGGNVAEGEKLAAALHDSGLVVIVPSGSQCASACFLLLAAAPSRAAGASALVGVHNASIEGRQTADTLLMGRLAGMYGVPPAIIGKMAATAPGRIEWLTHHDLALMDVTLLDDTPVQPEPAALATAPPEAEFAGALFCTQGTARLTLRTRGPADGAQRQAVFAFGPMAAGRPTPAGAFMLEGRLDLAGDALALHPTGWLSAEPADFAMLGLRGRSEDGGKTFAGRATLSPDCTTFTLKRVR